MRRIPYVCLALLGCAAYAAADDWVALDGVNGWSTGDPKHPLAAKLKETIDGGAKLTGVAFAPDGNWVVLHGANGFATSKADLPACKKLADLQERATFHCVAFKPNGGWVILYGQNGYWAEGVGASVFQKIGEVAKRGGTLRSVSFAPGGGWVLLCDEFDVLHEGIPKDLADVLAEAVKKRLPIRCVSFADTGAWFALADNEFWTNDADHPAARALTQLRQENKDLRWLAVAPADVRTSRYWIEAKPAQRVRAELTTDIAHPGAKIAEWYVFCPQAPNLPGQQDVRTSFTPKAAVIREQSPLHRPLLLAKVAGRSSEFHGVLTIEATLMSRHLRPLRTGTSGPEVKPLSALEVAFYTRSSKRIDYEAPAFQAWRTAGKLTREPGESEMNFARRAFLYIKNNDLYEFPTEQHSASQVCVVGKSDCGGMSCQFAAVLRSQGLPARVIAGRWAESEKDKDSKVHVKAEFFAPGVGWVPVDCAVAVGDKKGSDFAHFGQEGGTFLTFADDQDFVVDTIVSGKQHISMFQGVAHWWRGTGASTNSRTVEHWTVAKEKIPAEPR
jgi:Transglutaminase-like superfamily